MFRFIVIAASLTGPTLLAQVDSPTKSAQRPADTRPQDPRARPHLLLSQVREATVLFDTDASRASSGTDAGRDTSDARNKKSASTSTAADVHSKLKVKDLVLHARNGEVAAVAIAMGGTPGMANKTVLVPASSVHWSGSAAAGVTSTPSNPNPPAFVLRMSAADLEKLPPFEPGKDPRELDRMVDHARPGSSGRNEADSARDKDKHHDDADRDDADRDGDGAHRDGKHDDGKHGGGDKHAADSPDAHGKGSKMAHYVLASMLGGSSVAAKDRDFGTIQEGIVDPVRNTVDYVVVAPSTGKTFVAPFAAMTWTETSDGMLRPAFRMSAEELQGAPEFKRGDASIISSSVLEEADRFFGGHPPARAD